MTDKCQGPYFTVYHGGPSQKILERKKAGIPPSKHGDTVAQDYVVSADYARQQDDKGAVTDKGKILEIRIPMEQVREYLDTSRTGPAKRKRTQFPLKKTIPPDFIVKVHAGYHTEKQREKLRKKYPEIYNGCFDE